MINHPYPEHVVEAVAEKLHLAQGFDDYGAANSNERDEAESIAHAALQALWEASRVDTVEQLVELPDTYYVIDANGYWGEKDVFMRADSPSEFPLRIIYWGDSNE